MCVNTEHCVCTSAGEGELVSLQLSHLYAGHSMYLPRLIFLICTYQSTGYRKWLTALRLVFFCIHILLTRCMDTHSFTRRLIFCWFWSFRICICSCHCLDSAANWSFNSVSFLRCSASSWASRSLCGRDDSWVSRGVVEQNRQISSRVGARIGKCVTVCVSLESTEVQRKLF